MDNLKIKPGMLFIALDGDGIGKLVGRAVIANDVENLHKVSARIDAAQDFIMHWAKQRDGIKISGGGDEATLAIDPEHYDDIESLRKDIHHAFGYTISVGVGKSLSEAGTALLVAKLRGKDRIVRFSQELKKDLKKAKRRVREKRASVDEYKLSEAYLKKAEDDMADNIEKAKNTPTELSKTPAAGGAEDDSHEGCAYCDQTDGVDQDHCTFCHDQDESEECPFCQENESSDEVGSSDCPFCQENPDGSSDCPFCQDDAAGGQKQPEVSEQDSGSSDQDMASALEATPSDDANAQLAPPEGEQVQAAGPGIDVSEGAHSDDTLKAIAAQIESESVNGKPEDKQEAAQIDDSDVVNKDMEGNISRPSGYSSDTPGDLGLDQEHGEEEEGSPDLSSVLKEGLNDQADEAQKEKVRTMIGQALQGFKSSKQILEAAREQAPDFYAASIAMLAAMIHMAGMLGLKGSGGMSSEEQVSEDGQPQEDGNEWSDPFPKHPDHGGEAKPQHAAAQGDAADSPQQ